MWAPILLTMSALTIVPIVLLIGALAAQEAAGWDTDASATPESRPARAVARVSAYGKYTCGIYLYQWAFILVCQQYLRPRGNGTATG